jgi:hypothetical protein
MERYALEYLESNKVKIKPLENEKFESISILFYKLGDGIYKYPADNNREPVSIGITYFTKYNQWGNLAIIFKITDTMGYIEHIRDIDASLKYDIKVILLGDPKIKNALKALKGKIPDYSEFEKIVNSVLEGYIIDWRIKKENIEPSYNIKELAYFIYKEILDGELDKDLYLSITDIKDEIKEIDRDYILDIAERFVNAQKDAIISK